jgi:hypothetical protein
LILFLAVWVRLLLFFSRRHFVEHAVFAMHLISFTGLTVVLMWPLYYFFSSSVALFLGKFLFDAVWVGLAIRRVYGCRTSTAILLALAVHGGYGVAFQLAAALALSAALP